MSHSTIHKSLKDSKDEVDEALHHLLDESQELGQGQRMLRHSWHEAMEYSLFSGGKRLRPILTITAAHIFSSGKEPALSIACALEMIHTYSLIHDDLPALDNDTLRRGQPTCHTRFGVHAATWAGFTLLSRALTIISKAARENPSMHDRVWRAGADIFRAAGIDGMVGGQVADLLAEGKDVLLEDVTYIHENKTAALIKASVMAGCKLYCNEPYLIESFSEFGYKIGLAFQIIDDILDIQSDPETLGKNTGSDIERGKATYPAVIGIEAAQEGAKQMIEQAVQLLDPLPVNTQNLTDLAIYLYERKM